MTLLQKISCELFWLLLPLAFPNFSYLLYFPPGKLQIKPTSTSPRLKFLCSFSFFALSVFSSAVLHLRHRHLNRFE